MSGVFALQVYVLLDVRLAIWRPGSGPDAPGWTAPYPRQRPNVVTPSSLNLARVLLHHTIQYGILFSKGAAR